MMTMQLVAVLYILHTAGRSFVDSLIDFVACQ